MGEYSCAAIFNRRQIGEAVEGMGVCPCFPAVGGLVFHKGTFVWRGRGLGAGSKT
jgi:hypothetical protein